MSTAGSKAGLDLFEQLEINYEHAYGHNELKRETLEKTISLVPLGSCVLDVGCGTGSPVSETLAKAGLQVVGCDISPRMIQIAQDRVPGGVFIEADMLEYKPQGTFAAILIMFSHLQLSAYGDFHAMMHKFAGTLQPEGLLVIGTMPSDDYVKEASDYDETGTYAVDCPAPFMGQDVLTFFLTAKGMERFVTSMGLEIVYQKRGLFQPEHETAVPEDQQYIIAKRVGGRPLGLPSPRPK